MQFKDYIQGNRRGKQANRIEREAMNDPFLQDAIDGFDAVEGDHAKIIEQLEYKIHNAKEAMQERRLKTKRRKLIIWSAAASILLIIGLSVYNFLDRDNLPDSAMVMLQSEKKESEILDKAPVSPIDIAEETMPRTAVDSESTSKTTQETSDEIISLGDSKRREAAETKAPVKEIAQPTSSSEADKQIASETAEKERKTPETRKVVTDLADNIAISQAKKETAESPEFMIRGLSSKDDSKKPAEASETTTYSGKVVDAEGMPLPGVTLNLKGSTAKGTLTDNEGSFTIRLSDEDSKILTANYIGFESKDIELMSENQTITLLENAQQLEEVVIVGFGTQKKETTIGSVAPIESQLRENASKAAVEGDALSAGKRIKKEPFGEKEFKSYCKLKATKNICNGKTAVVKVSFFIDATGKPTQIKFKSFTCENAKIEIENLLSTSPEWTTTNRNVSMTIRW